MTTTNDNPTRTIDSDLMAVKAVLGSPEQYDGDICVALAMWGPRGHHRLLNGYTISQRAQVGDPKRTMHGEQWLNIGGATKAEWFARLPQSLAAAIERVAGFDTSSSHYRANALAEDRRHELDRESLRREIAAYEATR